MTKRRDQRAAEIMEARLERARALNREHRDRRKSLMLGIVADALRFNLELSVRESLPVHAAAGARSA